jgi:hypothetical protein
LLGDVDPRSAGADDARTIFSKLLPRAFRRPVVEEEVETYVALTSAALDAGRPFMESLRVGLQAMLCSPEFLFREEPAAGDATQISQHALAARLSYFLWSSLPDDELLSLANAGRLAQPDELRRQVERMLADEKSRRFVENFTGQWLKLRESDFTEPDMLLNERLARHYGIEGVAGQPFRRVSLPEESVRGGVLTQAAVLKVTANGTNTSPVVRGVWVLDNILGRPSPPPPAGVPAIEPDIRGATTIREQLARHRDVESCAACHRHIDPPGFALESFDAIGGLRTWYRSLGEGERVNLEINRRKVAYRRGLEVDPSGRLADGRSFADVREFKALLLNDPDQIARCLAEKLFTYALGRGLGFSDRPAVEDVVKRVRGRQYGFRALIHEVVQSETFRTK